MRSASDYRGARRNEARRAKLIWRDLPKRIGSNGPLVHGMQTIAAALVNVDFHGKRTVVLPEIPRGLKYGTARVMLPSAHPGHDR